MIASGFKPVAWVAGVGVAALGCYMLSLQVAAERASLAGLDRSIVAARQQIRSLQTELGTRGRIQQLEAWNDQVLALSAPVSGQFVEGQVSLARFDTRPPPPMADTANVRMASADSQATAPAPDARAIVPQPQRAVATANAVAPPSQPATVQRTSLVMPATSPGATAPVSRAGPLAAAGVPSATSTTAQRTRPAEAGPTQATARKTPTTANTTPARTATAPASTPPRAANTPTRTAATTTRTATPLVRTTATTTRAATPPVRTTATTSTPRPSPLLGDRAMRDLRTRAERERGTGN